MDDILHPFPNHQVEFSAQDILASMGFEAQRLAAAVSQHAAGAPFPDPRIIQQVIDRMAHLNKTLLNFAATLTPGAPAMSAEAGMTVKLSN